MRVKLGRRSLFALGVLAVAGASVGGALAAFSSDSAATYTGCLSKDKAGQIAQVAAGLSPRRPCGPNEQEIHLGGGDITSVVAGSGLTGGGDSGAVTVALDPALQTMNGQAYYAREDPGVGSSVPNDGAAHVVVSLSLAAGKYALSSSGMVSAAAGRAFGICVLRGPDEATADGQRFDAQRSVSGADLVTTVSLHTVLALAADAAVTVTCRATPHLNAATAESFEIVAVAVS